MATPTLGGTPVEIDDADVNTGWTLLTTAEAEVKKEGTNSMSGIFRADLAVGFYTITSDGDAVVRPGARRQRREMRRQFEDLWLLDDDF